jgi:hypothetical protein
VGDHKGRPYPVTNILRDNRGLIILQQPDPTAMSRMRG